MNNMDNMNNMNRFGIIVPFVIYINGYESMIIIRIDTVNMEYNTPR